MDETTTRKLEDILSKIDNTNEMDKFMKQPKVADNYKSFTDYFKSLPAVKEKTDSDLIKLSGIEKSYYYQIMKKKRKPSRDKLLRLCIGAGLTLPETSNLLQLSEYAVLYPKKKRDVIISVAINQHITVIETNLLLDKYHEDVLS
jgi:transcriptional regulator with XRE-family HTH domain